MSSRNTTIPLKQSLDACSKQEQLLRNENADIDTASADFVSRLVAGDRSALARLARDWGPRLFRYIARYLDDAHVCQDLTQETLLRAVNAIMKGTRPGDLEAWLYRIATNLVRDEYRSAYHNRVAVSGLTVQSGADVHSPEELVIAQSRQRAVQRALTALPADLREVVNLRYYENLPVRKIAEILGIPEGTVKSRLYRAYRRLEQELVVWIDDRERE